MNLRAFDIPEDYAELGAWLDRQLTGLHLGELVDELAVVNPSNGAPVPGLAAALEGKLPDVLEAGLTVVTDDALQRLLRHPALLLELQERVFVEGGPVWKQAGQPEETAQLVGDGESRFVEYLASQRPAPSPRALQGAAVPFHRQPVVVSLATAAAVLAAVLLLQPGDDPSVPQADGSAATDGGADSGAVAPPPPVVPVGWGWTRPGAIVTDVTGEQYFNNLADLADEWFLKRPEDGAALAQRITEFRHGCSLLFLERHEPLFAVDRDWLTKSCRKWADELEAHLADLETQQKDVITVRDEMDATVRKFVKLLRKWAGMAARRGGKPPPDDQPNAGSSSSG